MNSLFIHGTFVWTAASFFALAISAVTAVAEVPEAKRRARPEFRDLRAKAL